MKESRTIKILTSVILIIAFWSGTSLADKTTIEIEAPDNATAGSEVTIRLNVSHDANNLFHYTDLVFLKINGVEVKRWEYSSFNKPPAAAFTLEYRWIAAEPGTIEAEGDCNIHGSAGAKAKTISIRQPASPAPAVETPTRENP